MELTIDDLAKDYPDRADEFKVGTKNLIARQRLISRKDMEAKLGLQPQYINLDAHFLRRVLVLSSFIRLIP